MPAAAAASEGGDGGAETVRIGFSGALQGRTPPTTCPAERHGVRGAKEINDKGGVDGYRVEIVAKDNKGDQAATAKTTQELLDDGIKLFVLTTGATSIASGQLVDAGRRRSCQRRCEHRAGHRQVVGDRAFMIVYGDNAQAAAGAEYACDKGDKTAYLLGSNEIPYTKYIPQYFEKAFASVAAERSRRGLFKIGQTDFNTQVAKIKSADPAARRHLHVDVHPRLRRVHEAAARPASRHARRDDGRQRLVPAGRTRPATRPTASSLDLDVPRPTATLRRSSSPISRARRARSPRPTRSRRWGATTSTRSSRRPRERSPPSRTRCWPRSTRSRTRSSSPAADDDRRTSRSRTRTCSWWR